MHIIFSPKKCKKMKTTCPPTLLCVFFRLSSFNFLDNRRRIMFLPLPCPHQGGRGRRGKEGETKRSWDSASFIFFPYRIFLNTFFSPKLGKMGRIASVRMAGVSRFAAFFLLLKVWSVTKLPPPPGYGQNNSPYGH